MNKNSDEKNILVIVMGNFISYVMGSIPHGLYCGKCNAFQLFTPPHKYYEMWICHECYCNDLYCIYDEEDNESANRIDIFD